MDNNPEELEAQKQRAFRPPVVDPRDELRLIGFYTLGSTILLAILFFTIAVLVLDPMMREWSSLRILVLKMSFVSSIIFGVIRAFRFSMSQVASDPLLLFTMKTDNVKGHMRDLISLAISVEWDIFGLIGSLTILLLMFVSPS